MVLRAGSHNKADGMRFALPLLLYIVRPGTKTPTLHVVSHPTPTLQTYQLCHLESATT